jgi:hypothetical protein
MGTATKSRIDVATNDLLMNPNHKHSQILKGNGSALPEPVFPRFPGSLRSVTSSTWTVSSHHRIPVCGNISATLTAGIVLLSITQ